MGLHIVIDGYNLIRQSSRFSIVEQQDLQSGREALVDALAEYKRAKHHAITVVFDGAGAPVGMPRKDRIKGINLRFSRMGETADTVIKRIAAREKQKLLVVTSDNEILTYAEAMGAAVISAPEFDERLIMTQYLDSKGADVMDETNDWPLHTKKKGPPRRLPKSKRRMVKRISKI